MWAQITAARADRSDLRVSTWRGSVLVCSIATSKWLPHHPPWRTARFVRDQVRRWLSTLPEILLSRIKELRTETPCGTLALHQSAADLGILRLTQILMSLQLQGPSGGLRQDGRTLRNKRRAGNPARPGNGDLAQRRSLAATGVRPRPVCEKFPLHRRARRFPCRTRGRRRPLSR